MKVNERYSVERIDAYNIVITEYRTGTKGKSVGKRIGKYIGFYGTWEGAFDKLLEMSIDSSAVRAWHKELRQTKDDIMKAIKENSKEISK